ncbi:hypothetical protein BDZ91DRAFT_853119, partial [Kalaharituber pfeilii]
MSYPFDDHGALIIGIDFGTTYSGVAWCYTGDASKVKVIKQWPGLGQVNGNSDKVPTVICYAATDYTKYRCGFEVTSRRSDDPNRICLFKLLLNEQLDGTTLLGHNNQFRIPQRHQTVNPKQAEVDEIRTMASRIPAGKTPKDVVADYLRGIYTHAQEKLQSSLPSSVTEQFGKEIPVKYHLTVPAIWSDRAKDLTVQAARDAGMTGQNSSITLISEPEAAAVNDLYVVTDCGGGTVDLISYQVTAIQPRLQVKECAAGTGSLCGSTALNRRFHELLKSRLGDEAFSGMSIQARHTAFTFFDENLKPRFRAPTAAEAEDEDFEPETFYCPVPGVSNNTSKGIMGGFLAISVQEMVNIFDPVITEIAGLVQAQVDEAERRSGHKVTGVLLVGGFGSSEYLRERLATVVKSKKSGNTVEILQPSDAWSAIVQGAVLDGVASYQASRKSHQTGARSMVQSRIARFSYGMKYNDKFDETKHPWSKRYWNIWRSAWYCHDRMFWFIKRGEELHDNKPIRRSWVYHALLNGSEFDFMFKQTIYCCYNENPPEGLDESCIKMCTYQEDFRETPRSNFKRGVTSTGAPCWQIPFDALMLYRVLLQFSSEVDGV